MEDVANLRKVRPSKLADLVSEQLTELISSSELKPGVRLPPEHELMERFGVARSVVREALVRLQALGIVEIHQGRGAFVAPLPIDLLMSRVQRLTQSAETMLPHVWELREILETSIAGLAAERRTARDVKKLQGAVDEMAAAVEQGDLGTDADARFHFYLTEASHNPALVQVMQDLSVLIADSRKRSLGRQGRPASSNAEHKEILEAVRNRDAAAAREAMRRHMQLGKRLTEGQG